MVARNRWFCYGVGESLLLPPDRVLRRYAISQGWCAMCNGRLSSTGYVDEGGFDSGAVEAFGGDSASDEVLLPG